MSTRLFDGNRRIDAWPANARIAAYGDGLYETMRVCRGAVPWWDAHWARLQRGAQRLGIALPGQAQVIAEVASLFDDAGDGVLKLVLGRGGTARGYAPAAAAGAQWMVSRNPLPDATRAPLHAHWCALRLAIQPALAGMKHCNRLEQVLARAECGDAGTDEGLLCDIEGMVVCATSANLFAYRDGCWWTPPVDRCGVAGVCREHLLALLGATQARLSVQQVEGADAVFLCNAVRGILPLGRVGMRTWRAHPAVIEAARKLAGAHPGLAFETCVTEAS